MLPNGVAARPPTLLASARRIENMGQLLAKVKTKDKAYVVKAADAVGDEQQGGAKTKRATYPELDDWRMEPVHVT